MRVIALVWVLVAAPSRGQWGGRWGGYGGYGGRGASPYGVRNHHGAGILHRGVNMLPNLLTLAIQGVLKSIINFQYMQQQSQAQKCFILQWFPEVFINQFQMTLV